MKTEMSIPWINQQEILSGGHLREHLLLVDVRTAGEFEEAHIPGSVNVPLGDIPGRIAELVNQGAGKEMILLCRTQNRVKVAYEHLTKAGVVAKVLEGGMTTWIESGHPVSRGGKSMSLERQVRMVAGTMVVVGVGLGVFLTPWFLLLPLIVGGGLIHAGATDSCAMALLLSLFPFNRRSTTTVFMPSNSR